MVQFSHPYMTIGKIIALTRWTFTGKVMSLLFNMLSRLVIAFLPRSNYLFNFMASVTICSNFGAQENKVCHSKVTLDIDCNDEIKRCLLLGRKTMTNLDSILKSRAIPLPTKGHTVKPMVFPVVMYGCKAGPLKKKK